MASRKNCSEIKLSAGDSDENGPFPRSALQMDTKATSSRDPDVRPGPNRTAAHRRNGRGTYTSVGMLRTPGGPLNTKTAVTASSASTANASRYRPRGMVRHLALGVARAVTNPGTRMRWVRTLERVRVLNASQ